MEIKEMNNMVKPEIPNKTQAENNSVNETAESGKSETNNTISKAVQETEPAEKKPVRGDGYISTEKELKDASGLYRVSHKPEGGMDIKFDDIKLQKKRNDIKSEITRLKSSNIPEDKEKAAELTKKLAAIEKKIRMQKQK